ncbi:MAG: 50S ribosomal protein L30 [Bacillota bacterium]
MANQLKIVMKKSSIGADKGQKGTLVALGLRKIGQSVEKNNTPQIRGMVNKVSHLVEVEEI